MVRVATKIRYSVVSAVFLYFLSGCWAHVVPPPPPIQQCADLPNLGTIYDARIVEIEIKLTDLKRYPALRQNMVGWRLSRYLAQAASDTDLFNLVQHLTPVIHEIQVEGDSREGHESLKYIIPGGIEGADYLLSAEVYGFVACSP